MTIAKADRSVRQGLLALLIIMGMLVIPAAAATTAVHIIKYDTDGTTVLGETTVDYLWMEANLPVLGDGVTHYYHQGPVFIDDPDPEVEMALRWNPEEDKNCYPDKDMGAVKGTNAKDLCDLVGGMDEGDEVRFKAADGWPDYLAYENIYEYSSREGPVVLTWYMNGKYPDTGYNDGMRMVWFADTSVNPWGEHVFGAWDWHEAADEQYWYYYQQGTEMYPTTTGLSGKYISEISIYSHDAVSADFSASPLSGDAPMTVTFTDLSTAATAWEWDFDNDGTVDATEQNPVWTYTARGTYTVSLTVTGATGTDTETKTDYISVTGVPVANFAADVTKGAFPLTVTFSDLSTSTPTGWAWDFENDGTVDATVQNPVHTYDTAGIYTVSLAVTNAEGSDSEVKTDYITVTVPGSTTWYVDDDGGADFTTIQAAVDAANAGDEIVVGEGTYAENVNVNKQLVIRSENGASAVTVTAASTTLPVFDVNADGVTIEGFTVRGPTDEHVAGIEIVGFDSCLITGNDCALCYNGIHLGGDATGNTVEENSCHENTRRGISIRDTAYENYISGNTVENNVDAGICIKDMPHDNVLWLNAVIGNGVEILTANTAHSPEPITYTYEGGLYTGYLGNYYDTYAGTDSDGDGVGETAFTSGSYADSYPLAGLPAEYTETVLFVWGPYLTGTTTTGTIVNVKTPEAATVTVEYADDDYYTAHGGYELSATGGAGDELHHVALTGLDPGTLYHYRVVRESASTGDLHFSTLPESGPFSFIVYSDTQDQLPTFSQEERHKLVADRIAEEEDIAFVLHCGDLVNDATLTTDWDRYFAAGSAMFANMTVFPTLGNHDQNAPLYYEIYGMPEWYSFDCANAHFTVLDSNSWAWPVMDEQTAWLESDLATPADWNFVTFHHPPYSSSLKHYGGYLDVRDEWEGVLTANGVDMVMNGDIHAYERYLENGTTYAVLGIGGGPSYQLAEEKIEGYQNSLEFTLGYAKVTVDPVAGTTTVEVIPVAEISSDLAEVTYLYPEGSVFETFVLESPTADFTADVVSGDAPLTVQFTDESTGSPLSWVWDFDDDGTVDATVQNPSFTYDTAGTYTVSLTVTNAAGSDDEVKTEYITVTQAPPRTWYVDDDGGADFTSIQPAVDAASPGDTVIVRDGYYIENVDISKRITLQSEKGSETTIIETVNPMSVDSLIDVTADYVNITGFTLTLADVGGSGINLIDADYCIFTDTVSETNSWGIRLRNSTHNVIRNTVNIDCYRGIALYDGSNENVIDGNEVSWNADYGIWLESSHANTIVRNNASGAEGGGAFNLRASNDNIISENLLDCYDPEGAYGLTLEWGSTNNRIYLNTFKNTIVPANGDATGNLWVSPGPVDYIYGSATFSSLLGNYWDRYTGTDGDGDGIGDTPYTLLGVLGADDYPLMGEWNDGVITFSVQPPTAAFSADVTSGDAPLAVQFTDQSTGDAPLTYAWDFDNDGTVDSTEQNPAFTYNTPGAYSVSLTVTNVAGSDEEIKIDHIVVNVPPVPPTAAFTADVTEGDAPLSVQFTDQSTGDTPLTYAWDFENDGTVDSTEQNPSYTYSTPGTYSVSLTVTNVAGSDEEVKIDHIVVNVPPVPPTAAFTADVTEGDAPLSVQFTDQSTGDTPLTYAWDFDNDGTVDSTEQSPSFTYDTPGTYSVSLIVTNAAGSDTEVKTDYITVNVPPVPPTAEFTADVTEGDAPLAVQFTDQSTGDSPLTYAWDFENDGTVDSTDQNPSFIYNVPGIYTVSLMVTNLAGSDDEVKTDYITVSVPPIAPTADFTADLTSGDAPLTVQFTDLSTGDMPMTYAWDFENDGTVDSTEQNPAWTYDIPGIYTVSLTVTNVAGSDSEVKSDYIMVNVPPVPPMAAFTADVTSGDAPLSVQFTDQSTGDTPFSYAWDFENDGTVDSTEQNPAFTYDTPGMYTVSLTVTNIAGSDDEVKTDYITVNIPPVAPTADFTADVTEGDAPLTVQFTDQSTGDTPLSYAWDFENDGTVDSTEQNPAFIYNTPGIYTVSLTVANIAGSDDEVKTDYITVNVPPVAPTADFTADVTEGDAPLAVQFTDLSTGDTPLTYAWDFNSDGTVDSAEQNPSHVYDIPGIYTVSLTITNIAGSDDEVKTDYITVNVPPVAPAADFMADVTSGDAPLTVQFTDLSTGDTPMTYAWDFESDGTVDSTAQNPSHVYETPGIYTVSLTVTNIAGSDDEVKTDYITVNVPPVAPTAAFTADITEGDAPLTAQFTDQSTGDTPMTYAWDFENDGTVDSTEQNPAFIYNSPGVYTVSLTVTNIAGSDDEVKTDFITVNVPPVAPTADFIADVTSGDAPLSVQFMDQSTGDTPMTYAWDFENDGTIDSTEQNPAFTYDMPGIYTVSLTITNIAGSDDEVKSDYITVNVPPVAPTADFTADVTSGDAPLAVQFTDLSTGDSPLSWAWDFENDGTVDSTDQNPSFVYDVPGTYTVSLAVTNIAGSDSEVKADYITVTVPPIPPTAVFTADVTEGDAPLTVQFTDQSTGDSPLSWAWDFENDGTIDSTEQNPAFIYNTPGVYTVSLTVTNVAGIDDVVKTDYITVTVPPVAPTAAFTADVTSGNAPLTVQFTDQSMGDTPLTYAWDFETDGTVDSTEQNPAWIYDTPGIYTVTLTVTNVAGSDAEAKTDYITVTAPAPVLTTIVVSPATAVLAVGSGRQFTATAFDESGLPMGGITFGWGSSDEGVGTVDAAGYFTALAAGTTTITASSGTVSGTAKATVTEAPGPVASITIVPDAAVLAAGKCLQFTATARDGNGVEIPGIVFDWSCSDETVGTVDENGLFTGVAPGTADVIASTGGCEASVTVEVTPEEPTAVPEFPSLAVPVGMLIGIVGVVFGLRGMGVRGRDGTEKK